jgi:hypothetical protein
VEQSKQFTSSSLKQKMHRKGGAVTSPASKPLPFASHWTLFPVLHPRVVLPWGSGKITGLVGDWAGDRKLGKGWSLTSAPERSQTRTINMESSSVSVPGPKGGWLKTGFQFGSHSSLFSLSTQLTLESQRLD